jgi:hypothetical protein
MSKAEVSYKLFSENAELILSHLLSMLLSVQNNGISIAEPVKNNLL